MSSLPEPTVFTLTFTENQLSAIEAAITDSLAQKGELESVRVLIDKAYMDAADVH